MELLHRSCLATYREILTFELPGSHCQRLRGAATQREKMVYEGFFQKPRGLLKNQMGFERFRRFMMVY